LASFGKNLLTVFITGLGLIPFLFLYPITFDWKILLFPFEMIIVMLFGTAIGLFFVPIAALFTDLSRAIHLGLRFAFFLTPVVYPIPATGTTRFLMLANPISSMIVTPRWSLLGGEDPALEFFLVYALLSLALLLGSLLAVKVALPHILERLSGT
jgi:ABC-type polysaccharide/polyol phosphate export permease